jgi:hypothetical protein
MRRRSAAISDSFRVRTSRATGTGSGTLHAKGRRSFGNWSPMAPGKHNAVRRRSARISSAPSAAITAAKEDRPDGYRSLSGACDVGDAEARNHLAGESGNGPVKPQLGLTRIDRTRRRGSTAPRQDRERDSGCIPWSDMAQRDAAGVKWEQPHTLSCRSASADDAEWMSGKSRARLAPVLTEASSWMSDRSARRA